MYHNVLYDAYWIESRAFLIRLRLAALAEGGAELFLHSLRSVWYVKGRHAFNPTLAGCLRCRFLRSDKQNSVHANEQRNLPRWIL